jgi:hypothetical protein
VSRDVASLPAGVSACAEPERALHQVPRVGEDVSLPTLRGAAQPVSAGTTGSTESEDGGMTEGSIVWVCVAGILVFAWMLSHLPPVNITRKDSEAQCAVEDYDDAA